MLNQFVKDQNKTLGLMTHIICGYPSFEANWEILEEMDKAKIDIVEMQFPFSEPIADGPVFAMANQKSIENGTTIDQCFDFMKKATDKFSFKIVMMGYYNTVYKMGENDFCARIKASGGQGIIIPDVPLEESNGLRNACKNNGIDFIPLTAPTNSPERLTQICEMANEADSLVYAVARKGVTGNNTEFDGSIDGYLAHLKKTLKVPLAVGFGISKPVDLEYLTGKADMAVIGTAVLKSYESGGKAEVAKFFNELLGSKV